MKKYNEKQVAYVEQYYNAQLIYEFKGCCDGLSPKAEGLAYCDEVGLTESQFNEIYAECDRVAGMLAMSYC